MKARSKSSRCRPSRSRASPIPDYREPELTGPQRMAADILRGAVSHGGFTVDLLDGVTGSGKTEVYFEAIAETIRKGRQALVLMPEIALTAQFLDRFAQRFGVRPAEWHSELGAAQARAHLELRSRPAR